jgi:hypothetical protein
MQALNSFSTLLQRIDEYRKRYFLNQLLKGGLIFVAMLLSLFLLVNTAEFYGRFSSGIRAGLFFGFIGFLLIGAWRWVVDPLLKLYGLQKPLSDEEAARQIGGLFPGQVGDKLLNTLQLHQLSNQQNELLLASLNQRSEQLLVTRFANAIQLGQNRRYLRYAIPPLAIILGIVLLNPAFFSKSSTRLVQYQEEFAEEAPFRFIVNQKALQAYRNEDLAFSVRLAGSALPDAVYLVADGTRFKLEPTGQNQYGYTFDNVQRDLTFTLEAAGFRSARYAVTLIERPSVLNFDVRLTYPAYLNKPAEQLTNVGNLLIPQGTLVTWRFTADHTDSLALTFRPGGRSLAQPLGNNTYSVSKQLGQSVDYAVYLANGQARLSNGMFYNVQVIPDRYPQISATSRQDTVTYNFVSIGGTVTDDYGFSQLKLVATIKRTGSGKATVLSRSLPINRTATAQTFSYLWPLDSLRLKPGDRIDYVVQVWDNDGVNGPKSARTAPLSVAIPSVQELDKQVEKSAEKTERDIEEALRKSQAIKRELNSLEERMKTKKSSDFQDNKQMQDMLKKRDELLEDLKKLQEQFQKTNDAEQRFAEQNPRLQEKMAQLEKLFKEMADPETNKLFEELKQLLEKKQDDKAANTLDRLNRKERNMEKELERALKLFKQYQQDQKNEKLIDDLLKQAQEQEKEAQENAQTKPESQQQQADDQKKAQEDFTKLEEQMKELQKDAEKDGLRQPETPDKEKQEASEQIDDAAKQLQQNQPKKASASQSKAAKSMKAMAKAMAQSMMSAESKEAQENIDDLRNLLDNLITVSVSQERVMKDFRSINSQDPRIVKLSQEQLKLRDDVKIIEDSLTALAGRVAQIRSFVTREMTDMKYYMDQSSQYLKDRRMSQAASRQQFAMTSMNNLALMLSDALKNMQNSMNGAGMPGGGKGGKKGNEPSPGMGEAQKALNGKMQQLGKGGQSGRALSEELSNLAAQQAAIRKMLQQAQDNAKGTELGQKLGDQLRDLQQKMDQTETDLVNKRITPQTLNRQNEILTRLLESEKAIKEQEEDPTRKAQAAQSSKRSQPSYLPIPAQPAVSQVEVIRTVSPAYNPYFKNQANRYLQKVVK